jgi:hypothetical protein
MAKKMTTDEIIYAMDKLALCYKGERGEFIRSQGWAVKEFDREIYRNLMNGKYKAGTYTPVVRAEIKAKYDNLYSVA